MQSHADSKGKSCCAVVKALHHGFGKCLKICRIVDPVPLTLDFLEHKIHRLRQTVEDYDCAKFQTVRIWSFRFILLTYTHKMTVIAISCHRTTWLTQIKVMPVTTGNYSGVQYISVVK